MEYKELISAGNKIVATIFRPKETPQYAVIMNSATGAKQSYFRHFAAYLSEKGILVITHDYSGIGKSAPKSLRGYKTNLVQWGKDDLTAVIEYVSQSFEYEKLVLVNQSVGGQISPLSPSISKVDGMINVACSTGFWKMWPSPVKYLLWVNWYLLKASCLIFGYFPGKNLNIMENLPKGAAEEWANWGLSDNYLFDHVENADAKFSALTFPLISYSFEDDTTAPQNTIEWLNAKYDHCQLTYKHIKPADIDVDSIGHFGFFRKKCQVLWDDLIKEMKKI